MNTDTTKEDNRKKILAIIVSFALFITMVVGSASADMIIGDMETDIQVYGLSDFSARAIVGSYFAQRKAYLQGISNTIDAAVTPMVTDEATHRGVLEETDTVLADSVAVINSVIVEDYMAVVEATETATFIAEDETVQETISHTIYVYTKNDGCVAVCSDEYIELLTGFRSASYVGAGTAELANLIPEGSPSCIVDVALAEVGTTYSVGGATKYGTWYGDVVGNSGFDTAAWCAAFVAWCADQVYVPTYILPCMAYCPDMAEFFSNEDAYYHSASGGGSYTPQPGELIFFGVNESDSFWSPGHVGIVRFVSNGTVYYIEGNATTYVDEVRMKTVQVAQKSLTSTQIVAYAHPCYTHSSHPMREWEYDSYMHWSTCAACDKYIVQEHDLVETNEGFACFTCGYVGGW